MFRHVVGGLGLVQSCKTYYLTWVPLWGSVKGHVAAVGECGLDYERTKFCDVETQRKYFETQLELSAHTGLPLFLHNRASCDDLVSILDRHRDKVRRNSGLNRFCAP